MFNKHKCKYNHRLRELLKYLVAECLSMRHIIVRGQQGVYFSAWLYIYVYIYIYIYIYMYVRIYYNLRITTKLGNYNH